ncbi:MAG TPA: hypothetical protein VFP80_16030 [Thermoanaerobaculia bacterium]|nr:hypothetical protein [Thermoanaerobaculia bacterium]
MNEELRERLVQDLRKSGFYSEMHAIRCCAAAKWECHGSFTYFDKDQRATRECDFEAVRQWFELGEDGASIQFIARLLGQVKKSETPWIVFMDRLIDPHFVDRGEDIIVTNVQEQKDLGDALRSGMPMTRRNWMGIAIHEAFKKPTESSRWYSAFVSACKAAESAFDAVVAAPRLGTFFEWIKPVVVLDGLMLSAELSPAGEIVLTETGEASFAFEYRSDAYTRQRFFLDVVTLDSFPRYLDHVAARITAVSNLFLALRNCR